MIRRVARSFRRAAGWPTPPDYRALLFADLRGYLGDRRASRVLEIGPKDGLDGAAGVYYALGDAEGYELGRSL